ncbi:CBN-RNR-2 protein [Aphelenchoides avenae]|nr:CBN-RNR-2 protein [Aphelenchus avenae]
MRITGNAQKGPGVGAPDPDDPALVAPINGIGKTFINNLRIVANDRETFHSNNLYAYLSFMETELMCSREAKDCQHSKYGWFPEDLDPDDSDSTSFGERRELFKDGKTAQFVNKLHVDLFDQGRWLIPGVTIHVEIEPHRSDFALQVPDAKNYGNYKLELVSCRIQCKHLNPMEGLAISVAKGLEVKPARYPLRRPFMKQEFINGGTQEFHSVIFNEHTPRRVVLAFVDSDRFNGNIHKSPMVFGNHKIGTLAIYANGYYFPNIPYELDWDGGKYTLAYDDMCDAFGWTEDSLGTHGISMKKFKTTCAFFSFVLTTSQEYSRKTADLLRHGTTSVVVKFRDPVPAAGIYMITMAETDRLMLVNKERAVTNDLAR